MKLNRIRVHVTLQRSGRARVRGMIELGTIHVPLNTAGHAFPPAIAEELVRGFRAMAAEFDADFTCTRGATPRELCFATPKLTTVPVLAPNVITSNQKAEELVDFLREFE